MGKRDSSQPKVDEKEKDMLKEGGKVDPLRRGSAMG